MYGSTHGLSELLGGGGKWGWEMKDGRGDVEGGIQGELEGARDG